MGNLAETFSRVLIVKFSHALRVVMINEILSDFKSEAFMKL